LGAHFVAFGWFPATRQGYIAGRITLGGIMSKRLRHGLLAAIASVLFLVQPALAADVGSGQLVSVQWLEQNLNRDDVLVIDASPAKLHAAGHIPGAVNVDIFSFGGREIPPAEMERRIQSWGVAEGKKVIFYDSGGTYLATNLFFDLYYHGFPVEAMGVLDGGLAKWRSSGGAVTKDPTPAPGAGTFRIAKVREDARVRLPEFLAASGDPANHALVEALEPGQHFGGAKFFDRAGHVPNAIMLPTADFYNADKTFKSPEEIRKMLAYLGIRPEQQVHAHCGGGIAASVPFFAMKFMVDYPRVRLYKGSQLEWLRDDRGLPFWTYDAPNLLREKTWLSGWGSQMMRSFGVARLSVVDVRPAASFRQSHVPFAINVPAEVFRRHLATPAKLAEALGAAGVDVSHEAVVVSAGGLNPDSALAFLLLERLGQTRVSVFSESVDDWGFAGLPLSKETDAADPGKTPPGLLATPKPYPVDLRPGIVVGEGQGAKGLYPKVYIASGKSLPAKVPDGNVIHVPYTDLLNANGTPKAAKDIWNTLVKAGVPRYAEIISVSDDPGEAAANYFILKLMGYPDVKVLVM
jgi:thiosulfate/3-mercaptopyruvate sulfurtransferase